MNPDLVFEALVDLYRTAQFGMEPEGKQQVRVWVKTLAEAMDINMEDEKIRVR